ncbi:MAG TPA: hypothetical protein VL325_06370, partial [Pyrinomonadaceae bacterium]|nr:hypothetical protein [Pyrinomonadaceae bacterium]
MPISSDIAPAVAYMFHQRLKCLVMNLLFVAGDANGRNDPAILISYGRSDTTGADRSSSSSRAYPCFRT